MFGLMGPLVFDSVEQIKIIISTRAGCASRTRASAIVLLPLEVFKLDEVADDGLLLTRLFHHDKLQLLVLRKVGCLRSHFGL